MEIINKENFELRFPNLGEINMNAMEEEARNFYFNLYAIYMDLFYKYLLKNINLKSYEKELSAMSLKPIEKDEMDFYQSLAHQFLSYFYIRNNVYLERLANEQVEFMAQKIINSNFELDNKTEEIIESTFRNLIFENVTGNFDSNFIVNFGPNLPQFHAPVNALVLGIRFQNIIKNGNPKTIEQYRLILAELDSIIERMEEDFSDILKIPVKVILYDEKSIKKKDELLDNEDNLKRG